MHIVIYLINIQFFPLLFSYTMFHIFFAILLSIWNVVSLLHVRCYIALHFLYNIFSYFVCDIGVDYLLQYIYIYIYLIKLVFVWQADSKIHLAHSVYIFSFLLLNVCLVIKGMSMYRHAFSVAALQVPRLFLSVRLDCTARGATIEVINIYVYLWIYLIIYIYLYIR